MKLKSATVILSLLMASALAGAPAPEDKPLTKDQVMGLVRNQLGDESGAKVVEQRGIDFEPTDDFVRALRDAGAGEVFLKAVREARQPAKSQPAAQGPLDLFQISALLLDGVSSQRLAELVRQRRMDFSPPEENLQLLKDVGADEVLLDAIRDTPPATNVNIKERLETENKHAQIAEQDYRDRLGREPENVAVRILLVYALNRRGKSSDGLQILRDGIRFHPESGLLHRHLANALYGGGKGDVQGAIAEYREALRLNPNDRDAHYALGNALLKKDDLDGAIAEYREALRIDSGYWFARTGIAYVLERKGDVDGAVAEYRAILRRNPNNEMATITLGGMLERKGDLDGATEEYREAVRLAPGHSLAHSNLAWALLRKGDVDAATAESREAIRLLPSYAPAHLILGYALSKKGDVDGAAGEFREAVRLDASNPEAHLGLAGVLQTKGDREGALAAAREALRVNPNYSRTHDVLGAMLIPKGDLEGALAEYREAARLNPKDDQAHYGVGWLLQKKGDLAAALEEYRLASTLNPGNSSYKQAYELLAKQLGK